MSSVQIGSFRVVIGLLATLGVLAGCGRQDPQEQQGAPAAEVTVVTLKPQSVTLTRELPGRATAFMTAEVRPQVDGIIARRLFTEGGLVKAGQPLYQVDDATYRADLASAKAGLMRAQAALVTNQLNARRSAELVKIDAVSKQDDESAAAALRQSQADVVAAQAAVDRSSVVLGYARITSPINGRIGKSSVTQGALVTAKQDAPLATVQALDPIYIDVTQSAAELLELRKALEAGKLQGTRDLPVTLLLEDGARYEHDGKLAFADITVDPATGSYALRVVAPNPDQIILPGMYVRALVGSGVRQDALLVPQQGVARDPKGNTTAMVVGADSKVEQRSIRVSRTVADKWLVEEGLEVGDKVVIEGLQKIQPGAQVRATEAGATSPPRSAAASSASKS